MSALVHRADGGSDPGPYGTTVDSERFAARVCGGLKIAEKTKIQKSSLRVILATSASFRGLLGSGKALDTCGDQDSAPIAKKGLCSRFRELEDVVAGFRVSRVEYPLCEGYLVVNHAVEGYVDAERSIILP